MIEHPELTGILLSILGGFLCVILGVFLGSEGKVSEKSCKERKGACLETNTAKLEAIHNDIKMIKKIIFKE